MNFPFKYLDAGVILSINLPRYGSLTKFIADHMYYLQMKISQIFIGAGAFLYKVSRCRYHFIGKFSLDVGYSQISLRTISNPFR